MNSLRKKIQNRIKSTKGMSIGETLVSVLILLLATSVLVSAVSLGVRHYIRSLSGSEANVLASTLESVMTSELAYTSEIHVDGSGNVTEFQSQNYAVKGSLSTFYTSDGKMMIGKSGDTSFKLLGDGSYPNDLKVSLDTFTYSSDDCTFTIKISINNNKIATLDRTFQVINVNHTEAEKTS